MYKKKLFFIQMILIIYFKIVKMTENPRILNNFYHTFNFKFWQLYIYIYSDQLF